MSVSKNRTLMQKADMAVSDLVTDGGYLVDEQAERFIRYTIERSTLMQYVKVVDMKNHTKQLPGVHLNSRILRPGQSATALTQAQRAKPKTGNATLNSVLIKAEIRLDDETVEDNIERQSFKDTIMELITERVGVDLEELNIQGDTTSADAFLALYNGMLKSATTNIVAAGTVSVSDSHFRDAWKAMPKGGRRNRAKLRYLTSNKAYIDYSDLMAQRGTPLGDAFHNGQASLNYAGMPISDLDMMPEDLGAGSNETNILYGDPKNWHIGFHRRIRIEVDRDITTGETIIVVTMRTAGVYEYEPHMVKVTEIKV